MKQPRRRARSGVWLMTVFALIATLLTTTTSVQPAAADHDPTPITITITEITQNGTDIDPGALQGPVGDFYAGVTIDGVTLDTFDDRFNFPLEVGVGYIFPFTLRPSPAWVLSRTVTDHAATSTVAIEIWDNDDCDDPFCDDTGIFENNDDQVDASPSASETLTLTVDRSTGRWTGDVAWPQNCATGTGGEGIRVCFEVSVWSTTGDADGDSLLDGWEANGFNADGDTDIDVDLPAFGADLMQADLFVEVDCMTSDGNLDGDLDDLVDHSQCPRQDAMTDVVRAFANAPIANPDSTTGIRLHLDTGSLYAPDLDVAGDTGAVTGSIGDLGGGNTIPETTVVSFEPGGGATDFYALKAANFASTRAFTFRYALFANQVNARQPNFDCTSGWAELGGNDVIVSLGGRRDADGDGIGDLPCWSMGQNNTVDEDRDGLLDEDPSNRGIDDDGDGSIDEDPFDGFDNDGDGSTDEDGSFHDDDGDCTSDTDGDGFFCDAGDIGVNEDGGFSIGSRRQQAGTFMHELGHNLGFEHGGTDGVNDKPNYLSVMNYAFQGCGLRASPPGAPFSIPGGCDYSRIDVDLDERATPGLDECFGIGPTHNFAPRNWDGSNDGAAEPLPTFTGATCVPLSGNVSFDINDDGDIGLLDGSDDWSNVAFAFRDDDDFDDGADTPKPLEADPAALEASSRLLPESRHILSVVATGPSDVVPGERFPMTFETTNVGGSASFDTKVVITGIDGRVDEVPIGVVNMGDTVTTTVPVRVPPTTPDGTVLRISAYAEGRDLFGRLQRQLLGAAAVHHVVVNGPDDDVTVEKTTPSETAPAGALVPYILEVSIGGSSEATNVVLTDELPPGLSYSPADNISNEDDEDDNADNNEDNNEAAPEVLVYEAGSVALRWKLELFEPGAVERFKVFLRPSLLIPSDTPVVNDATVDYGGGGGITHRSPVSSAKFIVDSGKEAGEPMPLDGWRESHDRWSDELLARIQATDTRFDGADESKPDGGLTAKEVDAAFSANGEEDGELVAQLLATYLNLAEGQFHAGTLVESEFAEALSATTVAELAEVAAEILSAPDGKVDEEARHIATRALDEVNNNKSVVYQ